MPERFLSHLVGHWTLTGTMGETPLRQTVEAHWTLGGLFVEMHFKSIMPESRPGRPPYEAIYLVGYNAFHKVYVLHLFDTFGVETEAYPGLGQREGDAIPFVFNYPRGPFTNKFMWDAAAQEWHIEQTYVENDATHVFAVKHMQRAS
jgi:hypothetical protein